MSNYPENVVELFKKKTEEKQENVPFDWKRHVELTRQVQNGFYTLNAHQKQIAYDTIAEHYITLLECIFDNDLNGKEY